MILHLGDDVSVHSADIVAIIDLTQSQNPVTVYLSPISTVTLAQRAHERAYPAADSLFEAAQESEQPEL